MAGYKRVRRTQQTRSKHWAWWIDLSIGLSIALFFLWVAPYWHFPANRFLQPLDVLLHQPLLLETMAALAFVFGCFFAWLSWVQSGRK